MAKDYPDWTDSVHIIGTDIMVAVDLQAAYIMMPVDIQAQYVTLDINIASVTEGVTINIGTVTGTVNISIASVAGGVTFNIGTVSGTVTVTGTVGVSGTVNISGIVGITGTVSVSGSVSVSGTVSISGTVTITGTVNISGTVTITGSVTIASGTINIQTGAGVNINIDLKTQSVGVYSQPEWAAKGAVDKNFYTCQSNQAPGAEVYLAYPVTGGKRLLIGQFAFYLNATAGADADKDQVGLGYIINFTDTVILSVIGGHGGGNTTYPKPVRIEGGKTVRFVVKNCTNHNCDMGISAVGYEITV